MATVFIPAALRDFSLGQEKVDVPGGSLRRVFEQLDQQCPGIGGQLVVEDAIRPGLAIFIDDEMTSEGLLQRVPEDGRVHILPAMGGG